VFSFAPQGHFDGVAAPRGHAGEGIPAVSRRVRRGSALRAVPPQLYRGLGKIGGSLVDGDRAAYGVGDGYGVSAARGA
jgi:hypothetical protein